MSWFELKGGNKYRAFMNMTVRKGTGINIKCVCLFFEVVFPHDTPTHN